MAEEPPLPPAADVDLSLMTTTSTAMTPDPSIYRERVQAYKARIIECHEQLRKVYLMLECGGRGGALRITVQTKNLLECRIELLQTELERQNRDWQAALEAKSKRLSCICDYIPNDLELLQAMQYHDMAWFDTQLRKLARAIDTAVGYIENDPSLTLKEVEELSDMVDDWETEYDKLLDFSKMGTNSSHSHFGLEYLVRRMEEAYLVRHIDESDLMRLRQRMHFCEARMSCLWPAEGYGFGLPHDDPRKVLYEQDTHVARTEYARFLAKKKLRPIQYQIDGGGYSELFDDDDEEDVVEDDDEPVRM